MSIVSLTSCINTSTSFTIPAGTQATWPQLNVHLHSIICTFVKRHFSTTETVCRHTVTVKCRKMQCFSFLCTSAWLTLEHGHDEGIYDRGNLLYADGSVASICQAVRCQGCPSTADRTENGRAGKHIYTLTEKGWCTNTCQFTGHLHCVFKTLLMPHSYKEVH